MESSRKTGRPESYKVAAAPDHNAAADASSGSPPHEPINGSHDLLTTGEQETLKSDWSRLIQVGHQELGMRIFLRIFELEPSTKQSFPELYDLEGEELMSNPLFRCHGARFMRAVAAAVDNVDALDLVVVPNLVQLGRMHRSVVGLSWSHLCAFEQAMAEEWAAELGISSSWSSSASAPVWRKVFRLITSKVFEGFQLSSENNSVAAVKDDQQTTNNLSS